jgi:predicted phage-related endonuclease
MALGTELEPVARRAYEKRTGRSMVPRCVQSTRHDWLRASLDGMSLDWGTVVEIKCGESAYRAQVQHILAATGLRWLDFWCYWPGCEPVLVSVTRDNAYIERMLAAEAEFWAAVHRYVASGARCQCEKS